MAQLMSLAIFIMRGVDHEGAFRNLQVSLLQTAKSDQQPGCWSLEHTEEGATMKYRAYAVREVNGSRRRHFIGLYVDFDMARYMANCAMCDDVDLAYVEEIGGKTVFFLQSIRRSFNPQPIDPAILGRPNPLLQGLEDHLE